jgi:hypothetical protein
MALAAIMANARTEAAIAFMAKFSPCDPLWRRSSPKNVMGITKMANQGTLPICAATQEGRFPFKKGGLAAIQWLEQAYFRRFDDEQPCNGADGRLEALG